MSEKALVFVSCGQVTEAEKVLGKEIISMVDGTPGLQAYFAEDVNSLEGLSTNIFRNLQRAAAFITVMHHRGIVMGRAGDEERIRASVWIEQEIAIAAFLRATRAFDMKVAAYAKRGLHREGVRDTVILNALEFDTEDQVLTDLAAKLRNWKLTPYRSHEPELDVQLAFRKDDTQAERHVYSLIAHVTNTSAVSIPSVEFSVSFPSTFIVPVTLHSQEVRARATDTHRVFRGNFNCGLHPGDRGVFVAPFTYQMTHKLFHEYEHRMKLIDARVDFYANNRRIGGATRPFDELQTF